MTGDRLDIADTVTIIPVRERFIRGPLGIFNRDDLRSYFATIPVPELEPEIHPK